MLLAGSTKCWSVCTHDGIPYLAFAVLHSNVLVCHKLKQTTVVLPREGEEKMRKEGGEVGRWGGGEEGRGGGEEGRRGGEEGQRGGGEKRRGGREDGRRGGEEGRRRGE